MASRAFAPARSSSAISKSAWTRLGLAIQHNALVERVAKHSAGVQMSLPPSVDRAGNDIAPKSASRYGPVDLVVIQELLADDEKVVIALCPIGPARPAAKKDDRARMQPLHETVYCLRKPGILYGSLSHMSVYIGVGARIQ